MDYNPYPHLSQSFYQPPAYDWSGHTVHYRRKRQQLAEQTTVPLIPLVLILIETDTLSPVTCEGHRDDPVLGRKSRLRYLPGSLLTLPYGKANSQT